MALWSFSNLNKYGNYRTRIIYKPDGQGFSYNPKGLGPSIWVKRFRYQYEHPYMAPTLMKLNGKKYLMPYWKEVDINTTLDDINWIKPKPKKKRSETVIETFASGSSDNVYETKYYPDSGKYFCSCPGSWRSQGNCKHIKALRNKIENNG